MPEKSEKKDSNLPVSQSPAVAGGQGLASQESVNLLTKLLQDFERRCQPAVTTIPPEVEKDISIVTAAFDSIQSALTLGESPIEINSLRPDHGRAAGGERITICGSHLLPGATVFFGSAAATDVSVVSFSEIKVTAPPRPPANVGFGDERQVDERQVDVVVNTLGGSASLVRGYTYHSS
jgi:IPT/TIG domain